MKSIFIIAASAQALGQSFGLNGEKVKKNIDDLSSAEKLMFFQKIDKLQTRF